MSLGAARVLLSLRHNSATMVGVAQLVRAPGCGPGCRGFESPRSPHRIWRVTCEFDGSPKFFLTDWLEFWLGPLCDVDHMEARGAWCRAALSSAEALTRVPS
jgi:hypothetical protein